MSVVTNVARDAAHRFSKTPVAEIELVAGLGVASDAHRGATVQHRSRVAKDPRQPNLRQVHLLHAELLDELAAKGFAVGPGDIGENVTLRGIDLLALPTGARLAIGDAAEVEVTGLRNPCVQLAGFAPGMMRALLDRAEDGSLIRKAGVMAVVIRGGAVKAGDPVRVVMPERPWRALTPV
ncbi:MOSC domain-containing protein [soil metagenome]